MTTTCHITVVCGKQGHASCRTLLLQHGLFHVSVEFPGEYETVTKMREILATLNVRAITRYKIVVSVCLNQVIFYDLRLSLFHARRQCHFPLLCPLRSS